MEAIERLPREGVNEVARCLLRAALGHERTGDAAYLTSLAEDTLFTMRLRSDPQCKGAFEDKPVKLASSPALERMFTGTG